MGGKDGDSRQPTRTEPGYGPPSERSAAFAVDRGDGRDTDPTPMPGDEPDPPGTPPRPASQPPPAAKKPRGTPVLEIEVVHEHGPAPSTDRPWRTSEIWTRNRVYTLDSIMQCIEVVDRATKKTVDDHPFLGMRLVGGQHREGERIELSYPYPRPGTEAVFEQPGRSKRGGSFSRTSAVTRVVLRLHVVTVQPSYVIPTWEEISESLAPPPPEE